MDIKLIKYNAGNIMSVEFALKRLGIEVEVTDDFEKIKSADKVIFPGVGEASSAMKYLRERKLDLLIKDLKQPVLGICIGQQLLCTHSEEGDTQCIGVFEEKVKKFPPTDKVPHMGWNNIFNLQTKLFDPSLENQFVYYVHSFYAEIGKNTIATTNYILDFSAALHKDNFYATQFHPEKSGDIGSRVLQNFINL